MPVSTTASDDGREVVIKVPGRFDFTCHQAFVGAYRAFPRGETRFVVDLLGTEYMDSSALGMLLQLREYGDRSTRIALINGADGVQEILRIANFDRLFEVA
ncbi:MAG TPA: anti-sigma factor antagonist [Sedimenticola sp.]|nr:anti-sigma factor antagonist [Sedimenticola sp.]